MKVAADGLLKDSVSKGDVPGVVAVATDAKGTTYEGGFGKRVLGQPAEMTPDTVVWMASMTKAITGAAAMQQVERGKIGLDAPAKEVIPYLGEVEVLEGFDAAGKPRTRKPKRDITLRHLLTHTAGFSYEIWNADIVTYQTAMGVPGITGCENKALTTPLLFDPGERWDYGINIDWAGKMVEATSGQKLGQYLQGQRARAARHGQHGLLHHAGDARAARPHPPSRPGRFADAPNGPRDPAGAGVRDGRRRALRHGRRLREVRAHDAEPRPVGQRRAGAEARDRGADVEERHGRLQGRRCCGRRSRRSPTTRSSSRASKSSGAFPS